jgi:hypothetical protein
MFRRIAALGGALLAGFHLWLLGGQAWSGQLAEPDLLLRWLAAGALVGGLVWLRRRKLPLLLGRQAVAIWVLAALLHGPALADDLGGFATQALPEAVTSLLQTVAAAVGLALAALATARIWRPGHLPGSSILRAAQPRYAPGASARLRLLPRPPPLA